MKRQVQVLLIMGVLLMAGCAGLETRTVAAPIESAATKADHEMLATYYELKAKELTRKAEASRHQASVYGAFPYGSPKSTVTFDQYYSAVASRLEDAAQESLALAKQHRKEAAVAQQ
ncbi:MAG: hypothetical protein L0Z53_24585 [Acidobacteriales bacterium]|nr:hypothetical protein [Terriglobales bacterium]